MSDWDDLHGVTPPRISPEDADRLLDGTCVANANPEFGEIDAVLGALRAPAEATELAGLHSALVAFGAAVVTANDPSTTRTRPMIRKLLTGKAIATIGVVTLISAGAAAAGVVPTPFSASRPVVSHSIEHDAHDADDDTTVSTDETVAGDTTPTTAAVATDPTVAATVADDAAESTDGTDDTDGVGPDVNGPAKFGLCTAYAERTKHDDTTTTVAATPVAEPVAAESDLPVPFQALSDAAAAAGQTVAEFCADAVPGGSAEAPGKSGDNPSATAPGKSGDNPSATAPGKSGDNPSATAPGKSGDNPSATAPGKPSNPGGGHGNPGTTQP
jgi:hypothetical protein